MSIVKKFLSVGILAIFVNFACANENKTNEEVLNLVYENVVLKDIQKAIDDANNIEKSLEKKDENEIKKNFSKLVSSWKSVEAFYILGDLNEDFIDIPRLIDIFHNSNEDIKEQLDRAILSSDEPKIALFKNSLKSINALEYVIFEKDIKDKRVNELALEISRKISSHLNDIQEEYKVQKENFIKSVKKSNAIVINSIIQTTYKLKEWRVGDVMGLTKKYEEKPDNKRAEYFISKNSANAIKSILLTIKSLLADEKRYDFGDYLVNMTNGKQMKSLRNSLQEAINKVSKIKNDNFLESQELYEDINKVHVILFVEMIEELSINAKILDADGD